MKSNAEGEDYYDEEEEGEYDQEEDQDPPVPANNIKKWLILYLTVLFDFYWMRFVGWYRDFLS